MTLEEVHQPCKEQDGLREKLAHVRSVGEGRDGEHQGNAEGGHGSGTVVALGDATGARGNADGLVLG